MSASQASRQVRICNQRGLHARASAKFVKLASSFEAQIYIIREGVRVDACSIMGLLMLGAGIGSEVEIEAEGPDAETAVQALTELVELRFHEDQ